MKISENTNIGLPLRNLIGLVAAIVMGAWFAFGVIERLNKLETADHLFQADLLKKAEQEPKNLEILENHFQNIKKPGDEIVFFNNESTPLGQSFSRASNFFLLGAFLSIIIASLTVSICTLQFIRKHISYVAILKALGF